MTLNHIHLGSVALRETQAFYEEMFGFAVAAEHGDGVFLRDPAGFLIALDPVDQDMKPLSWFRRRPTMR